MNKQIITSLCDMKSKPHINSFLETQLLFGEQVSILEKFNNWFYCKTINDDYLGWIENHNVGICSKHTHVVKNLMCHCYEKDDIKSKVVKNLFFNSKVKIIDEKGNWQLTKIDGKVVYIFKKHLLKKNITALNWVDYALHFKKVPYLWGGKSILGIDCSGLVQISLNIAGYDFPRNSKDQFNYLNNKSLKNIERGCLIFWNGHVAIAIDAKNIIHSNAYHLSVVTENFYEAQKRIKNNYGDILGIKKVDY